MENKRLQNFIKLYSLKGVIEQARWIVDDNTVFCTCADPYDNVYAKIKYLNFDIADGNYGIFNAQAVLKTLTILDDDIKLTATPELVIIKDAHYDIELMRAEDGVIHVAEEAFDDYLVNSQPQFKAILDGDFVAKFLKAFKAIKTTEISTFTLFSEDDLTEFRLGIGTRIKFRVTNTTYADKAYTGIYLVNVFAAALEANKECDEIQVEVHGQFLYVNFYYTSGTNVEYMFVIKSEEVL